MIRRALAFAAVVTLFPVIVLVAFGLACVVVACEPKEGEL